MTFAYVTNDTAETGIKSHVYHYSTLHETVICDSDDVTGDQPYIAPIGAILIFSINCWVILYKK
jgi:hypothetical protein